MPSGNPLTDLEKERIEDLAANGLSNRAIAREIGRTHPTVQTHIESPDAQQCIANKLERVIHRTLDAITDENIAKANLPQKLVAIGIAVEKMQLLKGLATSYDVHVLVDAVQAIRESRRLPEISPTLTLTS